MQLFERKQWRSILVSTAQIYVPLRPANRFPAGVADGHLIEKPSTRSRDRNMFTWLRGTGVRRPSVFVLAGPRLLETPRGG